MSRVGLMDFSLTTKVAASELPEIRHPYGSDFC
jgi:hypothetical protein